MERLAMKHLTCWKESPYRKPLIVKGVRQVGKTWLLKEFGRQFYNNIAYFNCKRQIIRCRCIHCKQKGQPRLADHENDYLQFCWISSAQGRMVSRSSG